MKRYISAIINSSVGNVLEWYDFGLFAIFAPLFSQLFFPSEDRHTALIMTFGISAAGFLCRPVGALIFGHLGDKIGRARTLRLSILMISIPTLLIGLLPTYQEVGILAPILLVVIRMWQGISIGGEYSGNFIYLAESSPKRYRATCASFVSVGANFGILLAGLVGVISSYWMTTHAMHAWGWRIPYIASGILCIIVYKFRLRLKETNVFKQLKKHNRLKASPIKAVLQHNLPHILRTIGLTCVGTTFYYFCFAFLPIFLSKQSSTVIKNTSTLMSVLVASMILIVPLGGWLCDYVGRRKMLLFNSLLVVVCVIPGFYLLQQANVLVMMCVLSLFTIASSFEQGTTPIAIVENFPAETRYTGVSLGFSLGNGILGGTVPMICQWLMLNASSALAPAIYITGCAMITVFVVYFFVPETKGKSLSAFSDGHETELSFAEV